MILTANQTGLLNTAATWDSAITPGTIHASTNISITTAGKDSTTFTAPNLVNSCTGVWVHFTTAPAAGRDWTAELFLAGVGTGSIATIVQTDMPTVLTVGWVYFRLGSPVLFSSLVANTYKWNFKSTTANSGAMAADNTSATLVYPITTYNLAAAPTTADQCWIAPHNCTTAITVTVDGTAADIRGSGTSVTGLRQIAQGIYLGGSSTQSKATLKWDTAASASISVTGTCQVVDGGELQMGTVAVPYAAANTATYTARQGGGGTNTGIVKFGTGRVIMQGAPRTYYATTYVSGAGTAASPLIVSDPVDWVVGDRFGITATSANGTNYNETEYRFIITKNSATSYVVSSTSGGSENAFTFTHNTNAKVLLLTRNVNVVPSVATQMFFAHTTSGGGECANGDFNLDWVYIMGMGSGGGTGVVNSTTYGIMIASGSYTAIDYCVFDQTRSYGFMVNSAIAQSYTGNIFCASSTGANGVTYAGLGVDITGSGHTFTDHYFIGNVRQAVEYRGVNCTFVNPTMVANNTGGTTGNGALYMAGGAPIIVSGANIHANRIAGITLNGTSNSRFTNCELGTKGANQTVDVAVLSNAANSILFSNTNVGSTTLVSGHTSGAAGATLIAFDKLNQTENNHIWYTEYGSARSTGATLTDTTVRTVGTLNVRIAPENSSVGFKYEYKVLAVPGRAVSTLGFIERNAAFAADTCLVELFLPGSTVADASYTMPTTVGSYLVYNIAAVYSGTVSRYATVRISGRTTTPSAYLYVADIMNGTNHIIDLTTWDNGQPSPIMFEQLGDASSVWAVLLTSSQVSGTFGYLMQRLLTLGKFLALK